MPMEDALAPPASSRNCSAGMRPAKRSRYRVVPSAVACPAIMGAIMLPSRRSSLAIDHEDQPHRDQAERPQPAGTAARARQSQLQPAAPPRERAQDAQRRVRHLGEELALEVDIACECV